MADKKISALTAVADSDIGADDLLHIVDNPGGTPVNKKMTIGQMFENIPTHLAVDDIATLTATASNLASTFATAFDGAAYSADVSYTLDDGTDVGQIKVMFASTEPASTFGSIVTVSSGAGVSTIEFDTIGEGAILFWNGSNWHVIGVNGATVTA